VEQEKQREQKATAKRREQERERARLRRAAASLSPCRRVCWGVVGRRKWRGVGAAQKASPRIHRRTFPGEIVHL